MIKWIEARCVSDKTCGGRPGKTKGEYSGLYASPAVKTDDVGTMLKVIQDKVDALATSALSESNKQIGETGDPDCKIKENEAGDKGASKVSSEEDNNNANIPEGKWYHISGLVNDWSFFLLAY